MIFTRRYNERKYNFYQHLNERKSFAFLFEDLWYKRFLLKSIIVFRYIKEETKMLKNIEMSLIWKWKRVSKQ